MANFRYSEMDRTGKTNKSRFPYRESKEKRMVYLWGYIDGGAPVISINSYMKTFGITRRTALKDFERYPELIVIK